MSSSNAAASDRVVVCQRGSELAELEALLAELGVGVERHTGPLPSPEALADARLVIVSGTRLAEGRTPPVQRWPRTIAVVDDGSRTLVAHLARIGVALIVRRPIHPHALRLLLLHQLYHGPERRARRRVPIGHPIRTGGLFKQSATLLELSRTGARIELPNPPKVGSSIQFVLGRELTGTKPVKVRARVVRVIGASGDGRQGSEIGLAFVDPTGALGKPIQAILDRYANGPPTLSTGPRPAPSAATTPSASIAATSSSALPAASPTAGEASQARAPSPVAASPRDAGGGETTRRLPPSYTPAAPRAAGARPLAPTPDAVARCAAAPTVDAMPSAPTDSVALPGVETEIELVDLAFDGLGDLDALGTLGAEPSTDDLDVDFELEDAIGPPLEPAAGGGTPRDRRRVLRVPYDERVVALDEQAARVVVGRDLCAGGMRIEPNPDLVVGDVLEIALHAGLESQPLMLVAAVERDDGAEGLVLVFSTLSAAQRARLDAIVAASDTIVGARGGDDVGDRDEDAGVASALEADEAGSLVVGEVVRHVVLASGRSRPPIDRGPAARGSSGFTLIELMIVVAIIGLIASTAVPLFGRYQLRSKSSEVKTNLGAIRVVQEAHYSEHGRYLAATAEPPLIPGPDPAPFDISGTGYAEMGWSPDGRVYFSYAVATSADETGYTADAAADIDGDGILQIWGYAKPDPLGALTAGGLGCNPALLAPEEVGSCNAGIPVF